jgi:hypothetical protein
MRRSLAVLEGAALLVCTAFCGVSSAAGATTPTFTHDVAPILFKHCVTCHRPGQIAPMSLLSYAETRPWAKSIRNKVVSRDMPPWPAGPGGLTFRNDRRLTQDEIDTLVAWADGGIPQGDITDLPPAPTFADDWVYGKPDYVIEEPVEYQVSAEGEMPIQTFYSKLPFKEDRYIEKIEMKPSNVTVVHHANIHFEALKGAEGAQYVDGKFIGADHHELTPDEVRGGGSVFDVKEGQLISYVPGRGYEEYWPGTGKLLPAGQWLVWSIHYTPTGKPERDKTRIGLYFAKQPVRNAVITSQLTSWQTGTSSIAGTLIVEGKELVPDKLANRAGFASPSASVPPIPPYAENWRISAVMPIEQDITVYAFQPHCHLRCKEWQYFVTYPDGRQELLLSVPHYSFEWQLNYELAEPKKIPAGSRLMAIATYDNSVRNRYNPGPDKNVYWSEQSWDEMFQPKVEYSIDQFERKPSTQQR